MPDRATRNGVRSWRTRGMRASVRSAELRWNVEIWAAKQSLGPSYLSSDKSAVSSRIALSATGRCRSRRLGGGVGHRLALRRSVLSRPCLPSCLQAARAASHSRVYRCRRALGGSSTAAHCCGMSARAVPRPRRCRCPRGPERLPRPRPRLATTVPLMATNGPFWVKRDAGDPVSSASHASQVPPRSLVSATVWQISSAPAKLLKLPLCGLVVTNPLCRCRVEVERPESLPPLQGSQYGRSARAAPATRRPRSRQLMRRSGSARRRGPGMACW
jgi:hypothetical protein